MQNDRQPTSAAFAVRLAPDQLWRASASTGPILLVWIRGLRSDGRPAVIAVSFDAGFADEYSLVVGDRSPLAANLVFHTTVETTVDTRALIDLVADRIGVAGAIDSVRTARAAGRPVRGLVVGRPITSRTDARIAYRQRLARALVELSTPRFDPDLSDDNDAHDLPDGVLADRVRSHRSHRRRRAA